MLIWGAAFHASQQILNSKCYCGDKPTSIVAGCELVKSIYIHESEATNALPKFEIVSDVFSRNYWFSFRVLASSSSTAAVLFVALDLQSFYMPVRVKSAFAFLKSC